MENLKGILPLLLIIVIGWHIKVFFTTELKLDGIFQNKPGDGYVWDNSGNKDSRYLWENTDVKWQLGQVHPEYNVQASSIIGEWLPLPGYKFMTEEKNDLNTIWEPGQLHPNFKTWASNTEGLWIPVTGYKFVIENEKWVDVVWEPGQSNDELKVTAGEEIDYYIAYPGYRFVNPGINLEVTWTPGLTYPNNTNYIAGNTEGSWLLRTEPEEPSTGDYVLGWLFKGLASAGIKKAFGDNIISDKLLEESNKDAIRGLSKALGNQK